MPWTPRPCRASFTSSSLNGLMTASIFFIDPDHGHETRQAARNATRLTLRAAARPDCAGQEPQRARGCQSEGADGGARIEGARRLDRRRWTAMLAKDAMGALTRARESSSIAGDYARAA